MIRTSGEVREVLRKWLTESEHSIAESKDDNANFSFEIDFPLGQPPRQLIVQPKKVPDLLLVVHSVVIAPEHLAGLEKMKPKARESVMAELTKEFMFNDNQFQFKFNEEGMLSSVVFTYPIFFDGLSKNNLYRALDLNYKSYLYLSMMLSGRVGGGPAPSSDISRMYA